MFNTNELESLQEDGNNNFPQNNNQQNNNINVNIKYSRKEHNKRMLQKTELYS